MKHILAVLKYDYQTLQLSDDWDLYCETAIAKLVDYGFTGLIPEPHANVGNIDGWEIQLTENVNKKRRTIIYVYRISRNRGNSYLCKK